MIQIFKTLGLCTILLFSLNAQSKTFGTGADMSKLLSAQQVLAKVDDYQDKVITLQGEVTKVCLKMGCWLRLKVTDTDDITVKVKDGVMVFPFSAVGKTAYATGILKQQTMSLENTKAYLQHKAEENGEAFDANDITQPMTVNLFTPSGVTVIEAP